MPIFVHADLRRIDQEEFGRLSFGVMEQAFAVHNAMGRFFDENIYRDAVAHGTPGSQTEVRIEVRFGDFVKDYWMDLLVNPGAVFELKAVQRLEAVHRSQLLNYLLLIGLSHGTLINMRSEQVQHEFVNTHLTRSDLVKFSVADHGWRDPGQPRHRLRAWLLGLLRDVGTGLDLHLYESAVAHFFGGDETAIGQTEIVDGDRLMGKQKVRLAAPGWMFKVTTMDGASLARFEEHARRFLRHTSLYGMHWINITRGKVTFSSIEK